MKPAKPKILSALVPLPAQQDHHRVRLGWDETEKEDVAASTVVTLKHCLSQRAILMQSDFLALSSYQVVHNVAEERWH